MENIEKMENWEDIKYFIFHLCVFGLEDEQFFYLIRRKNERKENVIHMNILSCAFIVNKGLL